MNVRKIEIHIECENDAFVSDLEGEVNRVMRLATANLQNSVANSAGQSIKDVNGNTVAYIEVF